MIINAKKNIFIKILSICLIFSLTNVNFADDMNPNTWIHKTYDANYKTLLEDNTIEYVEIADLVHTGNSTILRNWNSFENNQTSQDVYDDYMDAYNSLSEQASSMENDAAAAALNAQAYAMKTLAENNVNDSLTNFYNYYIQELQTVLTTKNLFLSYYKAKNQNDINNIKKKQAERNVNAIKVSYDNGLATELEYRSKKSDATDIDADILTTNNEIDGDERTLKINCGKDTSSNIKIGPIQNIKTSVVLGINLTSDIAKAIENNINLKIYNRALANSETEENKNNYTILINKATTNIQSDIEQSYNSLQVQLEKYNTYVHSQNLVETEYNKAKTDYTNGLISKNEYEDAVDQYEISKLNTEIQLINLTSTYETYKSKVDGLANAS